MFKYYLSGKSESYGGGWSLSWTTVWDSFGGADGSAITEPKFGDVCNSISLRTGRLTLAGCRLVDLQQILLDLMHNQNIEVTIIIVKTKDITAVRIISELSVTISLVSTSKQASSSQQ